jgi:hypothetical protein
VSPIVIVIIYHLVPTPESFEIIFGVGCKFPGGITTVDPDSEHDPIKAMPLTPQL